MLINSSNHISKDGRTLLVKFECGRCKATELIPYEHSSNFSVESNMCSNPMPDGWRPALSGLPMLCKHCAEALNKFLNKE